MLNNTRRPHRGFTLIELLTVIAIIGILAAIIIPTVAKVRETAQRAVDQNNLREIGKAAAIYATDNKDVLPLPGQTTGRKITATNAYLEWFGLIAKYASLNDPNSFVSKIDGAVDLTSLPLTVLDSDDTTKLSSSFDALPTLSFNVVGGLKMSDSSTSVVAFTRGLTAAGTWNSGDGQPEDDVNTGVYKDAGGHVVFLGGNVVYFSTIDTTSNSLTSNTGKATTTVNKAIPYRSTVKVYGVDSSNNVASSSGTASQSGG